MSPKFNLKNTLLTFLSMGLIVGGWWLVNLIWFKPMHISFFYDRVFIEFVLKQPELLTQLRLLEGVGIDGHNGEFTDSSEAFQTELLEDSRRNLETLKSYDRAAQNPSELFSTDILTWFLKDQVDGEPFRYHNYPVNQLFGIQSSLPDLMITAHQVKSIKDAEYYLSRLSKFDTKFDQVIEGLKIREQKKIIPPRFVITKVLAEMRGLIGVSAPKNVLYTSFQTKLDKVKDLPAPERERLLKAAAQEIEQTVYPAYAKLIQYFAYLEPIATTDDGVWKFPQGDAFYAYALKSQTTSDLTPDQVHDLGLAEVARIQKEMQTILAGVGYSGQTIAQSMQALGQDPRFLYPDTEEGRNQILKDYQTIIDEIQAGTNVAFAVQPNAGVKVERIPVFKEKTAPGAYYNPPALDGSRPGIFYANLRNVAETPKWSMRTLAYHEAIPGHHFQIAIAQELEGLPIFRKIVPFTAYAEGWALYSEKLAWELGYQKDPYSNLGRLQAELFRAVRLVVDTGVHRKRWTRERAIQYMMDNTGLAATDVVAEIERYIVNPGQACAYKIGMIQILALRERVKKELGPKFDLKAFHDVVLKNGSLPLSILEEVVERYIQTSKAT